MDTSCREKIIDRKKDKVIIINTQTEETGLTKFHYKTRTVVLEVVVFK